MKKNFILVIIILSLTITGCSSKADLPAKVYSRSSSEVKIAYEKNPKTGSKSPSTVYTKPQSNRPAQTAKPRGTSNPPSVTAETAHETLTGYTIQAGAFKDPDNAAFMSDMLENKGLDPYYYKDSSGLFKVRFGNYKTKTEAENSAKYLKSKRIIDEYYIVSPLNTPAARAVNKGVSGNEYLRAELVKSAKRYIGVPYKWGGNTQAGIDCSGLTQAVYNLNGLRIPRNSSQQFKSGKSISKSELRHGDLVFFATTGGKRVSHVGIYIGNGEFIHAPSKGKKVRTEKLASSYFSRRYLGARTYI